MICSLDKAMGGGGGASVHVRTCTLYLFFGVLA